MPKLLIIQWGELRSILEDTNTRKLYIIDNQYLMNLDELGAIL